MAWSAFHAALHSASVFSVWHGYYITAASVCSYRAFLLPGRSADLREHEGSERRIATVSVYTVHSSCLPAVQIYENMKADGRLRFFF